MSGKTKIVVLRMKSLIYTGLAIAAATLLIALLAMIYLPKKSSSDTVAQTATKKIYNPGLYTTELVLGGQTVDIEVVVNTSEITSVRLVNPNQAVTTMYPLLQPTLEDLGEQIYLTQSLDEIRYDAENKYTSFVLLEAIRSAVDRALIPTEEN